MEEQNDGIMDIEAKTEENDTIDGENSPQESVKDTLRKGLTGKVIWILFIVLVSLILAYYIGYYKGIGYGMSLVECPSLFG